MEITLINGSYVKGKAIGLSLDSVITDFLTRKGLATSPNCCEVSLEGGSGGGGPYTTSANTPFPGQITVTDSSGANFIIDITGSWDFNNITASQCESIVTCLDFSKLTPGQVVSLADILAPELNVLELGGMPTAVPNGFLSLDTTGSSLEYTVFTDAFGVPII